jgi:hypothetical protein
MFATLYQPHQPAQAATLTANTCEQAAQLMGVAPQLVDVYAGSLPECYTVYVLGGIDDSTPFNQAATDELDILLGEWCEVCGPVVIVYTPTVQVQLPLPAAEADMSAVIAEFIGEVRSACERAGTRAPSFVANHKAGDEVLYVTPVADRAE